MQAGPPSQANISSIYFAELGLRQLMCIAVGGVPDSHNIKLFHSSQPITTSMGNKLHNHMFVWRIHSVHLFT